MRAVLTLVSVHESLAQLPRLCVLRRDFIVSYLAAHAVDLLCVSLIQTNRRFSQPVTVTVSKLNQNKNACVLGKECTERAADLCLSSSRKVLSVYKLAL